MIDHYNFLGMARAGRAGRPWCAVQIEAAFKGGRGASDLGEGAPPGGGGGGSPDSGGSPARPCSGEAVAQVGRLGLQPRAVCGTFF